MIKFSQEFDGINPKIGYDDLLRIAFDEMRSGM